MLLELVLDLDGPEVVAGIVVAGRGRDLGAWSLVGEREAREAVVEPVEPDADAPVLVVVDVDVFALQNAFEANYGFEHGNVVALLNAGASAININILSGAQSVFTRDVSMGGNAFTEAVQKELNLPYESAEQLKKGQDVDGATYEDAYAACPTCREVLDPGEAPAPGPTVVHRVPDAAAGALLCGMLVHHGLHAQLRSTLLPAYGLVPRDWSTTAWGEIVTPAAEAAAARALIADYLGELERGGRVTDADVEVATDREEREERP